MSVEWIILVTDKYKESRNFYKDILGFEVVREAPEENFSQFKLENIYLAIYGREELEKLTGQKFSSDLKSAIYTFSEAKDVDTLCEELKTRGVNFVKEPETQSWGQRTAYFTDPDGHIWEIQQWTNKDV